MQKTKLIILLLAIFTAVIFITTYLVKPTGFRNFLAKIQQKSVKGTSISMQPKEVIIDGKKRVKYQRDYTIVLLGDSMTEYLGNSDKLRADLAKYYPNKSFEILNYGYAGTNILSAQQRLETETFHNRIFCPIVNIDFDLILIESFGHNPLSSWPLEEGLQRQTDALDNIVKTIRENNSNAKIVFVGTLAPSKRHYGLGLIDLAPEAREKWALERIEYIKNHMEYAKAHDIPFIDIFSKSLNSDGDVNLDYINSVDYIHPSPRGIYFISDEIAKYISANHIL